MPRSRADAPARKASAGLLLYRHDGAEVFLVHPGGPFWARKDAGAWSIPKGEIDDGETPLDAAVREFEEETGLVLGPAKFRMLTPLRQPSGKVVHAWTVAHDCDAAAVRSNLFTMEWPPGSGRLQQFPEVDRAAWFTLAEARVRLLAGQVGFLDQLVALLGI